MAVNSVLAFAIAVLGRAASRVTKSRQANTDLVPWTSKVVLIGDSGTGRPPISSNTLVTLVCVAEGSSQSNTVPHNAVAQLSIPDSSKRLTEDHLESVFRPISVVYIA